MQSPQPEESTLDLTAEPATSVYPDTVEGKLQYMADCSLFYQTQINLPTTTGLKRQFYKKKLVKNNNKLYKYLVRTPNAYNPLMKFLQAPANTVETIDTPELPLDENGEEVHRNGFLQVEEASFVSATQTEAVAIALDEPRGDK